MARFAFRGVSALLGIVYLFMVCLISVTDCFAQSNRPRVLTAAPKLVEASPLQDDAALYAVTFVGSKFGCAVGDRGACWITRDGGATWSFSPTPVQCALRGVQFLTDQIGWAVGGEVAPYTRYASGVVIHTTDGGATWSVISRNMTPPLHQVRFVDEETGLAIGEASPRCPTGVLTTVDGGKTWTPSDGPPSNGWQAAAILPNGSGVVAGARGELGVLAQGALHRNVETLKGLRGIHALSLGSDSTGWLVGDGGLVQRTKNNGIGWEPPAGELPIELRECMDFHALAQFGDHVWISGAPGSVVWHSSDSGKHWDAQATPETTPIRSLHFYSETHGVAVGDLGKILVTQDGGATWTTVRGAGRHLAVLMIHADPRQVPFASLAYFSHEWGYRSGVVLMTRRDVGTDALAHRAVETQLDDAISAVGGSAAEIDWRLPLTVPGLNRDRDKLVEEWSLLTDQKLPQVVATDLAAKIRMWKPEVVMIAQPTDDDATAQVTWDSVEQAVETAAQQAPVNDIEEFVNLAPWQVKKVFAVDFRDKGTQNLLPTHPLDRAGRTIDQIAEPAAARLLDRDQAATREEGLRLVSSTLSDSEVVRQTLFGGINLPTGRPARRKLAAVAIEGLQKQQLAIQERQNFRNYSQKLMDSRPNQSGSLIAQLRDLVSRLPPDQGAKLLSDVARDYRERMLWEPAEESYLLLLDLYPDHPAAEDSAAWLLRFWTSEEIAWQRLRTRQSTETVTEPDRGILQAQFETQLQNNRKQADQLSAPLVSTPDKSAVGQTKSPVQLMPRDLAQLVSGETGGADVLALQADKWRQQANRVASLVEKTSPGFFLEPDVQLSVAALMRRGSRHSDADRVIDQLLKLDSHEMWNQIAQGELWLLKPQSRSPRPVATCRRTSLAPRLDGKLIDACWEGATEILLSDRPSRPTEDGFVGSEQLGGKGNLQIREARSLVMLMYDDRFLYIGASLPRAEGQSTDPPQHAGRKPDADLGRHDRLCLMFDTDRDYNTFYRFEVDQRGATSDACWDAVGWNPKWYVAAYGDDQVWRIEAAIPWEELTPSPPTPGTSWAAGLTRVMPTVGLQGWNYPLSETPSPQTFGLLRFE